jgi:hypothetical protein
MFCVTDTKSETHQCDYRQLADFNAQVKNQIQKDLNNYRQALFSARTLAKPKP